MAAKKAASNPKAAPAKTGKALAQRVTGTALANIDAELANEVTDLKNQIGQASGNKIKLEPTGDYLLPSGENLGNEIQIVVIDFVSKNQWYPGAYNPNAIVPPDCYAIGKAIGAMAPEDDSPNKQGGHSGDCATCPLNQFGSGAVGQSKACKNSRLAVVVVVDPDNPDACAEADAPLYTIEFAPTSIKAFDGHVSSVARSLNGPPIKAIVTLSARNVGTYAMQSFHDPEPNPYLGEHFNRRPETVDMLYRKPDFTRQPAAPARGARNAGRATPRRAAAPARR